MKKVCATLLVVLILISSLPIGAYAESYQCPTRETLIREACKLFPEYTSEIRGETINKYGRSAAGERRIVRSETRPYSDNRSIQYVEYSDGIVMLVDSAYTKNLNLVSTTPITGGTKYTAYITVTLSYSSETFQASAIEYTIYNSSYDKITSAGDLCDSTTSSCSFGSIKYEENASGSAYANYSAHFTPKPAYSQYPLFEASIKLIVGNNSAYVTVNQ